MEVEELLTDLKEKCSSLDQHYLGVGWYLSQKCRKLRLSSGVLSNTTAKVGKTLSDETQTKIVESAESVE